MMPRVASPALPALTGLRGVAAVWVVLFHLQSSSIPITVPTEALRNLLGHGWIAVDLFFMLSGFVLMHTYGRDFERLDADVIRRYAVQRLLRVYPTTTVVLLLILILALLDPDFIKFQQRLNSADFTLAAFVKTATLANRWGFLPIEGNWNLPTWSLSVELLGYCALPVAARRLAQLDRFWKALLVSAAFIAILETLNTLTGRIDFNDFGLYGVPRMACCFIAGASLAQARRLCPPGIGACAGRLAAGALAGLIAACVYPSLITAALPATAILIFALSLGGGRVSRFLSTRPILWLGRISFPLYVVQFVPLLWLTYRIRDAHLNTPAIALLTCVYLAACFTSAWLLHIAVERPAQRFARFLTESRVQPKLTPMIVG